MKLRRLCESPRSQAIELAQQGIPKRYFMVLETISPRQTYHMSNFNNRLERALSVLSENNIKTRVINAYREGGLFGIAREFNCDLKTAGKYLPMVGGGTYGESDIEDKTLHRVRAPQCIRNLLYHFQVSRPVISKIIRFYVDNRKAIESHRPSPPDGEALRQLRAGERLAGQVVTPKEQLENDGLIATLVPWYNDEPSYEESYPAGIFYVCYLDNKDVVDELVAAHGNPAKQDLLHGLAFGYKLSDVFNFVRSTNRELVDHLCGHVDNLPR